MIYLNLLIISCIVSFIIDLSGIIDSIKQMIWKIIVGKKRLYQDFTLKPFDCSLCMTFWTCLIYTICIGEISLIIIAYICFLSFFSSCITALLNMIKDIINKLINVFYKLID